MEIQHAAATTIRQLMHCVTKKHQTCLPMSAQVTTCFLRHSSDKAMLPSPHFFSTSSYNGTRLKTQCSRVKAFPSWASTLSCERKNLLSCMGSVRGMAGHSKWANIRHIKAAKDQEKARIIHEYSRKMRAFMRETGQTDPKTSSQLAKLIAEAKSKNVPSANIDRVLSQMISLKNTSPIMLAAKGPAGSVMLIEALTAKVTQTKMEVQSIVKKCGFSVFDSGSMARIAFEEKGVVQVSCPDDATPDPESYLDIAIEVGAEEVTVEDDEEGNKVLQFVCEPREVYAIKKELEARQLAVSSAEVVFNSTTTVTLNSSILELIAKAMEKLDEHPNVLRVYINVEEAS